MMLNTSAKTIKALHISFHRGCIKDLDYVFKQLKKTSTDSIELEHLFPLDKAPYWFDGYAKGNAIYNIGHRRAEAIWHKHKDYFNSFDLIITSDTAPLSRIFLQNNWHKPLIIWVCNRIDYCDKDSLDCSFPDPEYYQLLRKATQLPNVKIISYTPFEHIYARSKGVEIGTHVIKPCGAPQEKPVSSLIPEDVQRSETFFIPPYLNDTSFINLAALCERMGIKVFRGRYNGPGDLYDFKGIIHLPYAWSNLALFENWHNGLVYFIPSKKFILELAKNPRYFFNMLTRAPDAAEWYLDKHKHLFVYFDSWDDLEKKLQTTDLASIRKDVKTFAEKHHRDTLQAWQGLINNLICFIR